MTDEEKKQKVENLVNEYIRQDIKVEKIRNEEKDEALELGAEAMFFR